MKSISENIKAKIKETFAEPECPTVLAEFKKLTEYFEQTETQDFLEDDKILENIFSAILKLSNSNTSELNEAIIQTKKDWRNILYWSE